MLPVSDTKKIPVEKLQVPDHLFYQINSTAINLTYIAPFIPLIVYKVDEVYHIIDGCKRFMNAIHKNENSCLCSIIDPCVDIKHAYLARIGLNLNRTLSFREKYLFLKWLKVNLSEDEYNLESVKLAASPKERYELELIFGAPEHFLSIIETGHLESGLVPELLMLSDSDQKSILDFFSKLQFSRSTQREFIEWIPEIAFKNSCKAESVLNSAEIREILDHKASNHPQKMQKIRDHLFQKRFPALSEAKKIWTDLARKVNPDTAHIQFIPSDSFERNRLEIKITISNPDEIVSIFEKLKIIPFEQWEKLIYPSHNFCPEKK